MEIEGDRLKILDSSGYKGHAKEMTVDDFIKRGYTIDVNWLEDLKSPGGDEEGVPWA